MQRYTDLNDSRADVQAQARAFYADSPPLCGACDEFTPNEPGISGYRICDACAGEVRREGGA